MMSALTYYVVPIAVGTVAIGLLLGLANMMRGGSANGSQRLMRQGARLTVVDAQVSRLEAEIDALNADLAPLRSFVLPGGTPAAAALHLARTICRRAERLIVELAQTPDETVSDAVLKYVNRLSDFLFVASRYANHAGARDMLWVPGQNR